ncbi:MAG: hypothetical protein PHR82_10165, partial [Endomicrobiaceae bacterium]|nr:hypothetical protein [Endomicrobiaceae bacterium]
MKNIINYDQNIQKSKLITLFFYLLIGFIAFSLYYKTLSYDISGLDDDTFITMNFDKTSLVDVFTKTIFLNNISAFYRPILSLSFMIDNFVSNSSPYAMHTTNVLLHIISSLLIFFFLKRYHFNIVLSFLITLLFATHPINIFAVAWIPGRNDPLLFVFSLISVIFFIEYIKTKNILMILFHFIALFFALLTKEIAVLIPFICLGYYFRFDKNIRSYFIKIIIFWIISISLFFIIHQSISSHISPFESYFRSLTHSYKVLLDYYSSLYLFNIHFSAYTSNLSLVLGIIAFTLSLIFVFFSNMSKSEKVIYFLLPVFMIIISLFASQGFYQGSRLYIPLFCSLVIFGSFIDNLKNKKITYVFLAVLCLIASYITIQKTPVFQNSFSFFKTVDSEKPNYNINLANLYSYELLKNSYLPEASKKIKEISEITNYKNGYNLYLLSVIYIYEKNYQQAINILESIINFDKKDILIKL